MIKRPTLLLLYTLLMTSVTNAYQPDADVRKRTAELVKADLIAATPAKQQFSVRVALTGNLAFNDYERLARSNGHDPYDDCAIATFTEVTNWQIAKNVVIDASTHTDLYARCKTNNETVFGKKPLSQELGDREILRGMWQRHLHSIGQRRNDTALLEAIRESAAERFRQLRGKTADWTLSLDE